MNPKFRITAPWIASFSALLAVYLFLFPFSIPRPAVMAQTPAPTEQPFRRTISVTGSGSVDAQPDLALVYLGVQTDATTASQALTQNNQQMQTTLDTLSKAGIAKNDIRTTTVQLFPRYETPPPQPQGQPGSSQTKIIGYTAMNTVQITVRNMATLGPMLDQAVAAGSNTIQGINFDFADQSTFMDQAREAAMENATRKAQQLAGLANAKLGQVISISESSQAPIPYQARGLESAAAQAAVPISPGTQKVIVDIQVVWELQ